MSAQQGQGGAGNGSAQGTQTTTISQSETTTSNETSDNVLRLTLQGRQSVRWEEGTVDNEGLGRKSSKRCCIFHKQRAFGESSTDTSDNDDIRSGDESGGKKLKIAHKKGNKPPDFQRYHA